MTTMLERAAMAVVDTDLLSGGCHGDKMWAGEEVARAVLLAVREDVSYSMESGPVVSAGAGFCQNHPSADAEHIASSAFTAMIDAILNKDVK